MFLFLLLAILAGCAESAVTPAATQVPEPTAVETSEDACGDAYITGITWFIYPDGTAHVAAKLSATGLQIIDLFTLQDFTKELAANDFTPTLSRTDGVTAKILDDGVTVVLSIPGEEEIDLSVRICFSKGEIEYMPPYLDAA